MNDVIRLKQSEPLANGNARLVFQHPTNFNYLIKVIRPDIIEKRFGSGTSFFRFKRNRRYGQYNSFHREIQEYIASRAESETSPSFLQEIIGFIDTDLGLGLIVRAIKQPDGSLAPTLNQLIKEHQFNSRAEEGLSIFLKNMLQSRVVFSDMNINSLVYSQQNNLFVMIDGLGITNPIPLKALNSWVNRRSKLKRFARLQDRIACYKRKYNHP